MEPEGTRQSAGSVRDGRYRIEAFLGEGSVGAVYRAVDVHTGERVALKEWHPIELTDEVRGRFLREATALVTLDHPNIVRVMGHGFVDGVPYVALEHLEGKTLESLLESAEPLELALAFEIARQALSAVAYAHSHNVVHRDLKPGNLFIARDAAGQPTVKILDYGLAKFMSEESVLGSSSAPLTATGTMLGTPLYMPPEQAAGASVDLAADVYAMGCVLFEMLTGRPPYLADTNLELIHAHWKAPIPQLADALPGKRIAPALQALIDRALAKKQTERFPNAIAMLEALEGLPEAPIADQAPQAAPTAASKESLEAARTPLGEAPVTPEVRSEPPRSSFALTMVLSVLLAVVAWLLLRGS